MKSEKGIIEIFVIGIVIILFIILFTAIGIMIKEEKDYGVKEGQVVDKDYRSASKRNQWKNKVNMGNR